MLWSAHSQNAGIQVASPSLIPGQQMTAQGVGSPPTKWMFGLGSRVLAFIWFWYLSINYRHLGSALVVCPSAFQIKWKSKLLEKMKTMPDTYRIFGPPNYGWHISFHIICEFLSLIQAPEGPCQLIITPSCKLTCRIWACSLSSHSVF